LAATRWTLVAWAGRHAWAAVALATVIGLAVVADGDARTDGSARGVTSHEPAVTESPLPASEGLGGLRLPADPGKPGPRVGETAFF
jgi:hypothetical protein